MISHSVTCYHSLILNPMIKHNPASVCRLHDSILNPEDGPIKKVWFKTGSGLLLWLHVSNWVGLKALEI